MVAHILRGDEEDVREAGLTGDTLSLYKSRTSTTASVDKVVQLLQCWHDDAGDLSICHGKL